ncbi:MAG TPA: hypothetical protein VGH38_03210 [Bryobacteraceae bacterium]|jgi:hypothetical protein
MSGYLQRIASPALHSRSAIRPILGSIFAPREHPGPETEVAETRARHVAPPPQTRQPFPERPSIRRGPAEEAIPHTEIRPVARVAERFQPLLGDTWAEDHEVERVQSISGELSSQPAEPTPPRPEHAPVHDSDPAPHNPVREVFSKRTHSQPPAISAAPMRRTGANQWQTKESANRAAQREPDQIEIHIGRIEVTAVPQPQQTAPAVKQPRKALSLDEYLKRGRASS